jgi:hypothetical protein
MGGLTDSDDDDAPIVKSRGTTQPNTNASDSPAPKVCYSEPSTPPS